MLALVEPRHDDVAALDELEVRRAGPAEPVAQHAVHPGAGGVDQDSGRDRFPRAARGLERCGPSARGRLGRDEAGAGADRGAALLGVERVQHHQPGIIDPGVRIGEAAGVGFLQGRSLRVAPEVEGARAGKLRAPRQVVVEEEAGADHPGRPKRGVVRQHEGQRPGDVRREPEQHLALGQRLAHEAELVELEIAQAAMDELARGRGGRAREIVLLDEQHLEAAPGRIASDAGAVDAAADDEEVVRGFVHRRQAALACARAARRCSASSTKPAPPSPRVT